MSRSLVHRKSRYEHDRESFDYPFSEIGKRNYCDLPTIVHALLMQSPSDALALAGDFPNNIDQWIWSSAGRDDEMPWVLLCRLNNGAYALYEALYECSGFTVVGDMSLTVSNDLAFIVQHAMGNYVYDEYVMDTDIV